MKIMGVGEAILTRRFPGRGEIKGKLKMVRALSDIPTAIRDDILLLLSPDISLDLSASLSNTKAVICQKSRMIWQIAKHIKHSDKLVCLFENQLGKLTDGMEITIKVLAQGQAIILQGA